MKKLSIFLAFIAFAFIAQAQNPVIWACNQPSGGIEIYFDLNENCAAAPGDLSGMSEIGFHSGANMWSAVVDWDAAGALTAQNNGNDTFVVAIADPTAYYGIAPDNIFFVFNQGPSNNMSPWDSEGKMDDGAGGCADLSIVLADITETCDAAASIEDRLLDQELTVVPNPFTDFAVVSIENRSREAYNIKVTNMVGQVVRSEQGFTGHEYLLERGALNAGMYFVTFTNESGKFATSRVVVK